jgi:uncharacterized membrane protein (UPF0136 family)
MAPSTSRLSRAFTTSALRGWDWVPWLQWAGAIGLGIFWIWANFTQPNPGGKPFGVDALAYWGTTLANPYAGAAAGLPGAYLYSPAFLQAFSPLQLLPWQAFIGLWLAFQLIALAWLMTPAGALVLLAFPPVASEVLIGNIHVFLAVALVLAIRRPAMWMLALLTKPSLAAGIAWYVGRGEWRALSWTLAASGIVALISFVVAPALWFEWAGRMLGAGDRGGIAWTVFLVARVLAAAVLAWWAGRRNRPAFLPVALYLALPIPWLEGLTMLAAVPRLLARRP